MALDYRQVKDIYDTLHDAGVVTNTLPDWSTEMNRLSGSDLYSAGLHDNLIKRASVGIDRLLEKTGLPEVSEAFGRSVGETVGAPESGARIGKGLPRTTLNFAPFLIPGAGWGVGAARLGLSGLLSGTETYTETGSPAAGLLSGGTVAAFPSVVGAAERAAGRIGLGAVGRFLTGQGAIAGLSQASEFGQQAIAGEPLSVHPTDMLLNLTLGQLPFAGAHLLRKGFGLDQHAVDTATRTIEQRQAQTNLDNKTPVEKVLEDLTPEVIAKTKLTLAKLRGEQVSIKEQIAAGTLTPEDGLEATNKLLSQEAEVMKRPEVLSGMTVFGDSIQPESPRTEVLGKELRRTAKWRAIRVSDDESNPPELRGKVVGYSTAYEPDPVQGLQTLESGTAKYSLPGPQWWTVKSSEEWASRFKKTPMGEVTPELPVQPVTATPEQYYSHLADLKKVEVDVDTAQSPADLQAAVVRLNSVEHENDLPPTNDSTLAKSAKVIEQAGVEPQDVPKVAVKARAKKVARILRDQQTARPTEKVDTENATLNDAVAHAEVIASQPDEPAHAAFKDDLDILMSVAQTRRDAKYAFDSWVKTHPEVKTDFQTESERFQLFKVLRWRKIISEGDKLSDSDLVEFQSELKKAEIAPDNPEELRDFPDRLYIREWDDAINERLKNRQDTNASPKLEAAPNWLFSVGAYDPLTNTLNQKHKLPNSGELGVAQFRNMAGVGKPLTQAEIDLYKVLVPEAFAGEKVNVPKLFEGLRTKGPVVEVKKLGGDTIQAQQVREAGQLRHEWYETLPDNVRSSVDSFVREFIDTGGETSEISADAASWLNQAAEDMVSTGTDTGPRERQFRERAIRWAQLQTGDTYHSETGPRYSFISPKPESEMPGYVEGLVRIPHAGKERPQFETWWKTEAPQLSESEAWERYSANSRDFDKRSDPYTMYRGPHFGSEDTNVLAFFRGYEETLPDGTKAFHVIEVQSDWGQARREQEKVAADYQPGGQPEGTYHPSKLATSHPLLKVYETLALKAAIAHAKEVGATKVILSDAETAMMTEGHDRTPTNAIVRYEVKDADTGHMVEAISRNDVQIISSTFQRPEAAIVTEVPPRPATPRNVPQEKGMRLHYDQTLPSAMEKLTGERGQTVDLGQHKTTKLFTGPDQMERVPVSDEFLDNLNERERRGELAQGEYDRLIREEHERTKGSPVFRDSSGQPKTQITGRAYDISHLPDEPKFTLTDPNRAPQDTPFLPNTPEDVSTMSKLGDNGTSAVAFLSKSENPAMRALAQDLSRFGDALNRVEVRVVQTKSGASAAYDLGGGRTRIVISHAHLDSPSGLDFSVAHELVHGLTISELNNPTKQQFVGQFEDIRQRLVDALPKTERAAFDTATSSNWYEKWGRGEVDFNSLYPKGSQADRYVLYGLLQTKEMVAQGLSSRPFQQYMRTIKSEGKVTWFNRFTNLVKDMLGFRVDNTVFGEFLSKTDQLLEHGNFVSSFSDFSEHYFEGLGMTEGLVQANTRRALGVILNSGFGTSTHEVINQIADTGLVRSSEFALAQRDATKMFQQKGEPFELTSQVMDELGYTPDQRGLDDFTHESLLGLVSNHADALELLPDEASKYVTAKVKDMQNILGVLKAATNEKNIGLLNLADPAVLRGPVREAAKLVDRILEHERNTQEGQRIVNDLHAIAPDVYADRMVAEPNRAPEFLRDDLKEEKVGVLKRFLGTAAQLSRSDPVTAEYFERGAEIDKNRREMHRAITKVMGIDLLKGGKDLSKEGLKESVKVVENPRLEAVINKWMYWDNEVARKEGRGVTMLPDSHPEITKILLGLSAADRQAIIDTRAKTVAMTQVAQVKELEKRAQFSIARAAMVAVRDGGVKPADAIATTGRLWQAVTMDRTDPVKAQQADALIRSVQQGMSAEGFIDLSNIVLNAVEQHKLYSNFYSKNPAWATAQRQERWLVEYRRGNKIVQNQGSSKKEVLEKAKGAVITKEPWDQYAQDSDKYIAPSLSEESFNRLKELETSQNDMLRKVLSPEQMQEVERTSLVTQFAREQAARVGQIPRFRTPARQLSKGADELPWLWNHFAWSERMSNYWTRQLFRAQADLEIANPELQARPDLLDLVKAHKEQVLSPDPKLIRQVNRFTTTWYLSSLASPLINGFQTLTTMVPELTRLNGGRWLNSYSRWKDAVAEVSAAGIARKDWKGEHKQLIQDARVAGEVDRSMWDEDAATQDSVATRWQQMMSKNKVQTLGQRADSLMGATSTAGLWLFKQPEKFNRLVALLTGFDLAKEKGMSYEDAKTEAFRFNRAVNYGGGKINRPIGLFDEMPRSFAMLATNLQGYNLGVMSQLFRHIQDGYFRPAELKPGEIHAARKAALQMLGTQFVMAGTLGMPFVSGVVALLDKAFPGLEVNKHLREWMSSLFNEDDNNGHVLSDIAMTGLPSMMGWDMQSRLSVGNLVPGVSEYNGFQPELLLGPPMSLASTYLNGLGRVAMGDPKGAEAFIPPGIKKLFQLQEAGGVVKDYRNRPLFSPSLGERAGIYLGFQPKRLSDFNAADRIAKQNQDVTTRREGQFRQGLAEDVLKGNFGTVAQTLRSRVDAEPNYDVAEAVKAVARTAEEMTFPRDLRREGSARQSPDRQRLLSVFNLSPSQPSEAARLQFRQQVEQRLGLRSAGNRSEVAVAQLMDQLRGQNPDAPRAELRRQAESFLRRQRISPLLPALPTPAQ